MKINHLDLFSGIGGFAFWTKIITKIGNVIKTCPQCGIKFIDENLGYNLFEILTELFKSVSKNKNAEFYFVCKKECDGTRNRQDKKV